MARLYGNAIGLFGIAGFSGIVIVGALAFPKGHHTKADAYFAGTFILIGSACLMIGLILAGFSLQQTIEACWPLKPVGP
jgi:hypothetical protein